MSQAIARGIALFHGGFCLLNLLGELYCPGFDANVWWIDLRPLPSAPARVLLAIPSLLLTIYGIAPRCRRQRGVLTSAAAAILGVVAIANAIGFSVYAQREAISPGCPIPFSLIVAAAMFYVAKTVAGRPAGTRSVFRRVVTAVTITVCAVGFPLSQMWFFGTTDYRREAEAAVVFGARTYANGQPSLALADRVRTACALYREGLVREVVLSGGPGDGSTHETEAMRRLAIRLGVAAEDIAIDEAGVNTEATVRNSCAILEKDGARRVLVVSHFYHLPRIKLTYARCGQEVYTVPAHETRVLPKLPWYMAREVAAFWVYYLRPLQQV